MAIPFYGYWLSKQGGVLVLAASGGPNVATFLMFWQTISFFVCDEQTKQINNKTIIKLLFIRFFIFAIG